MSLYKLVSLKDQLLTAVKSCKAIAQLQDLMDNTSLVKSTVQVDALGQQMIDQLVSRYANAIDCVESADRMLVDQLRLIDERIQHIAHGLFHDNHALEQGFNSVDFVRDHWRVSVNQSVSDIIRQRIEMHTNWQYPALEIGCRDGEWTQYMIAADPLYIMDRLPDFISSATSQFTVEYQRRLRVYPLIDDDMSKLPQNQFAFIFSWGYFNYISMDTMRQYLAQAIQLLRPGGVFMFSYNDGDSPGGAGMAEQSTRSYLPKSFLLNVCAGLGFEVVSVIDHGPAISWLEIRRPGALTTNKAHQVLGEIKRREI